MVGGAIIPGKPVANMYFTLYGYQTYTLTLHLLRDLKLVCYTSPPLPHILFLNPSWTGSIHQASSPRNIRRPMYWRCHRKYLHVINCDNPDFCYREAYWTTWSWNQSLPVTGRSFLMCKAPMFGPDNRYVLPRCCHIKHILKYVCQIQSYNSDAISWGALAKPLYAPGNRYGVSSSSLLFD